MSRDDFPAGGPTQETPPPGWRKCEDLPDVGGLRDAIAIAALPTAFIIEDRRVCPRVEDVVTWVQSTEDRTARRAYKIADAMIKARRQ